jgi:hypothetical protein
MTRSGAEETIMVKRIDRDEHIRGRKEEAG